MACPLLEQHPTWGRPGAWENDPKQTCAPVRILSVASLRRPVPAIAADDVAAIVADVALAAPRSGIVEIAGPERAKFNEIIAAI